MKLGDSPLRLEDGPLVTGSGAYVADLVDVDTLHCAFVRSPIAHGTFEPLIQVQFVPSHFQRSLSRPAEIGRASCRERV